MKESTPVRGRPRSKTSRQAILAATFDALVAKGYAAMSVEAVASAAGVGKMTVYRWWPTKAEVAVESFFEATRDELRLPDTESGREDFRSQILSLAQLLQGPRGRALAGMLGGARNDSALADALRERWLNPRRAWGAQRMRRAIVEGQVREGVSVGSALALLYSPLYTPLLFGEDAPAVRDISPTIDLALDCIFAPIVH